LLLLANDPEWQTADILRNCFTEALKAHESHKNNKNNGNKAIKNILMDLIYY
jgi:hypothetical protein